MSDEQELLAKARAKRGAVLGAEYMDGQLAETNPTLVLAMTAAQGRMEEFTIHARSRTRAGVTDAEIGEPLFQVAAYAGAPASVSAKRSIAAVRATEQRAER
jgi:alkylhydroperoxidase/carboxymuconolactone decarboxylase family protein YurZ